MQKVEGFFVGEGYFCFHFVTIKFNLILAKSILMVFRCYFISSTTFFNLLISL
nr:MAG TPA: hypothetical protein [Caudoviricetes sp.]